MVRLVLFATIGLAGCGGNQDSEERTQALAFANAMTTLCDGPCHVAALRHEGGHLWTFRLQHDGKKKEGVCVLMNTREVRLPVTEEKYPGFSVSSGCAPSTARANNLAR